MRVTDDDGLQDTATTTINLYAFPVPVLTGTFGYETDAPYRPYVVWDATGSYDPDGGTIEEYSWDLDDDWNFEIIDGGITVTQYYTWEETSASAWLSVMDDEGDYGFAYVTVNFGQAPPLAMLNGYAGEGTNNVYWDASDSMDVDGYIVLYEWDLDNDGVFDDDTSYPDYWNTYETYLPHTCTVRVTDDDGLTATATATFDGSSPPLAMIYGYVSDYGPAKVEVTWDGSSSWDSDGEIVQYEWDLNFDGVYDVTTTTEDIVITEYNTEQESALCRLRVTDDDGKTDIDIGYVYFSGGAA